MRAVGPPIWRASAESSGGTVRLLQTKQQENFQNFHIPPARDGRAAPQGAACPFFPAFSWPGEGSGPGAGVNTALWGSEPPKTACFRQKQPGSQDLDPKLDALCKSGCPLIKTDRGAKKGRCGLLLLQERCDPLPSRIGPPERKNTGFCIFASFATELASRKNYGGNPSFWLDKRKTWRYYT